MEPSRQTSWSAGIAKCTMYLEWSRLLYARSIHYGRTSVDTPSTQGPLKWCLQAIGYQQLRKSRKETLLYKWLVINDLRGLTSGQRCAIVWSARAMSRTQRQCSVDAMTGLPARQAPSCLNVPSIVMLDSMVESNGSCHVQLRIHMSMYMTSCKACGLPTSKRYANAHEGKCKQCATGLPPVARKTKYGDSERNARLIDSGWQAYAREEGHYDQGDY